MLISKFVTFKLKIGKTLKVFIVFEMKIRISKLNLNLIKNFAFTSN